MVASNGYNKSKLKAMNRKQFVKLASLGAAVAATGGVSGCANKALTNSATTTSVSKKGAMVKKAVYVPNGKPVSGRTNDLGHYPSSDQNIW